MVCAVFASYCFTFPGMECAGCCRSWETCVRFYYHKSESRGWHCGVGRVVSVDCARVYHW